MKFPLNLLLLPHSPRSNAIMAALLFGGDWLSLAKAFSKGDSK